MTNTNHSKKGEENAGISPVAAAVAGAIVGVGVTVAGAVVLSDKKNRDEVKQVLTNVQNRAMSVADDMKNKVQDTTMKIKKKIARGKIKVKNTVNLKKNP